jgi:hypothetical protein
MIFLATEEKGIPVNPPIILALRIKRRQAPAAPHRHAVPVMHGKLVKGLGKNFFTFYNGCHMF